MSALSAIQIKRKQLGIQDDDWYDLVERMTGQRSTKGLKPKQSGALLSELDRIMGGRHIAPSKPSRKSLQGPYAKKIQALWIACWNLGVIDNRDDRALNKWAVDQANVDHANWIRNHDDLVSVVEALKKMLEQYGVDWSEWKGMPDFMRLPGYKIAAAQWALLEASFCTDISFDAFVREWTGKPLIEANSNDWIIVMNELGKGVRKLKKAKPHS